MKNQNLPKNWRRVELGTLCVIDTGKKDVNDGGEGGKYPFFTCARETLASNDYSFDTDAILVVGNGSYTAFTKKYSGKFDLYQRTYALHDFDKSTNFEFLYYYLKENFESKYIGGSHGAAIPYITKPTLTDFEILLPPLPTQKQIADVLSAYDDLIENNTKRIKILEQIAQAIYQEWFVYFRFPGHEKVKMIDSKTEFGKIPEGWRVEKLNDFVDFVRGIEPGSDNYREQPDKKSIPFLRIGDLGSRQSNIFVDRELAQDKILSKNDIVISMDGTVGIVKIGLEGAYSSGIRKLVIKNDNLNQPFLWQLIQSEDIQNTIQEHAKGTTILHASESINNMKFVLPPQKVIKLFSVKTQPVMELVLRLADENQNLRQARDLLLPKLVSGEIKI